MTEPAAVAPVWVLDATCLSHFARAERLDVLRDLLIDKECWTTRVVLEELEKGIAEHPALQGVRAGDWLNVAQLDTLDEVERFTSWVGRTGSGERDLGEASVFAVAELHGATAISDDREAVRVARTYGLDVHGTVWLLAGACQDGKLSEPAAGNLIDALRSTGMRLPCTGAEFSDYARRYGLLYAAVPEEYRTLRIRELCQQNQDQIRIGICDNTGGVLSNRHPYQALPQWLNRTTRRSDTTANLPAGS